MVYSDFRALDPSKYLDKVSPGRTATVVVAAVDSSLQSRAQADYVCDGTADEVEIQAAIDALPANGGEVVLLDGTFVLDAAISTAKPNITIRGMGDSTIIDASAITTTAITIAGSTGASSALTVNAAAEQRNLTVADASAFSAGDWILIRSEEAWRGGADAKAGEIQQIDSIAGNVITCRQPLLDGYLIADTGTVVLINTVGGVTLADFRIFGGRGVVDSRGISIAYSVSPIVRNIRVIDFNLEALGISNCVGGVVGGCWFENIDKAGFGYGITVGHATRDLTITDCKFYTFRHSITHGSSGTYGVQRHITIAHNVFAWNPEDSVAIESHLSAEWLIIDGNTIRDSALCGLQSNNVKIINNNCINPVDARYAIAFPTLQPSNVEISNNTIDSYRSAVYMGEGCDNLVISNNTFIGRSVSYGSIYLNKDWTRVVINGNTISGTLAAAINLLNNGAASSGGDISITGNTLQSNNPVQLFAYAEDIGNIIIADNTIEAVTTYGIWLRVGAGAGRCKNLNIEGNIIYDAGTTGIHLEDADDVLVTGNFLVNCTATIAVTNCTNVIYTRQHCDLFMDVLAISANHVVAAQALGADPTVCAIAAQPDVPRTLSWAITHPNLTAFTLTFVGVNAKGQTVTEVYNEPTWTGETNNAFATVTSITMSAMTGNTGADSINVGITDVLGLSNIIYGTGDVYKIKKNNANAVVAAAQVDTGYDTYDMAVIGLAVGDDFTIWFRSNLNIVS